MALIDLKDCTLYIKDGTTPTPNSIEVEIGEGNLMYTVSRTIDQRKARGLLFQLREGEQLPVDINFQFVWRHIISSGSENPTVDEVLQGIGAAATWKSASSDPAGPRTVKLVFERVRTCNGSGGDSETLTFDDFVHEELAHNPKDATIDCRGISNRVRPSVSRP